MFGNVLMRLGRPQEVERNESHKEKHSNDSHSMLPIFYDYHWSHEPPDSKEKVDHLYPIILIGTSEQFEDTKVA